MARPSSKGLGPTGFGFGVWGLGFEVWGLEFRVQGFEFRVYALGREFGFNFAVDFGASKLFVVKRSLGFRG